MKIAHFADVHFRGLSRHDEYRQVFEQAFKKLRTLSPDVIYIGGDIVHSKTQGITPELIDILTWWFKNLAEIAPVDVILGNHDGLLLNKDRQDAITPVISAINDSRIRLFKQSGIYDAPVPGFKWCVFSPFDEEGWKDIKPEQDFVNIALYHGPVRGAKSDSDFSLDGHVTLDIFENFDFGLFGDIHKRQYLNDAESIAYCGSTIQQNYGEDLEKGFLVWDIKNRNKFNSKFYKLDNDYPFVNVDWAGSVSSTIMKISNLPEKARIRFNIPADVSDIESRGLYDAASKLKEFSEVVFKTLGQVEKRQDVIVNQLKSSNLRDRESIKNVIETYLKEKGVDDAKVSSSLKEFDHYFDAVTFDDEVARNVVWSLKNIEFDNVFAYGQGNAINFENLPGITGIFGRNRAGKSSIIGTIVYTLFNTSDRGAMKNLHIINTDAETCRGKANLSVAGEDYEIVRDSIKNYPKKGEVWANTTLSLKKKSTGDVIKDLNDEQRRETEKIVRKIIGTADDFFYTCLAPQGQMNMFISEKSTSRKQILSRFLDLDIFDTYLDVVKQDLSPIKNAIKTATSVDVLKKQKNDIEIEHRAVELQVDKNAEELRHLRDKLSNMSNQDADQVVSDEDINALQNKVDKIQNDIDSLETLLERLNSEFATCNDKIAKIEDVRNTFSVDELKKQQDAIVDLEMKYAINLKDLESKDKELEKLRRNIEILSSVPCGDTFPTCVFIKDAHNSKKVLEVEEKSREVIRRTITILNDRILDLNKQDIKTKIEKINRLSDLEKDLITKRATTKSQIEINSERLNGKIQTHASLKNDLQALVRKKKNQEDAGLHDVHKSFIVLKQTISTLEKQSFSLAANLGRLSEKCANIETQIANLTGMFEKFEVLTLLENAFSKKGIPQNIIAKNLPLINVEISKILNGIAGFTIEIECDDTSSIDIFINYGDRRRIIELGSGMEKMIASIAIRVALTNISSLPKSDMLIIDEGFGVLDESNLEACARLLQNLKNYFRKIVIISHVDAIKDIVDNVLSIDMVDGKSRVNHV